jgi:predicted RNA-binding protein
MGLNFDSDLFEKKVDPDTGSILFFRPDLKGLPDRVMEGDGFTVEVKDNQVYMIDIFNSNRVLGNLLKTLESGEVV